MNSQSYRLNPKLDADALRKAFASASRLHIPDFLERADAERLYAFLRSSAAWRLVINQESKLFELDRDAQAAMTPEARRELDRAIHASARHNFQFCYETIRVPDAEEERGAQGDELSRFASFMSSPKVVGFLRHVTGRSEIEFADAQATAYGLGHFLTAHDDDVAGKQRIAAYVFNLTPKWRIDWGGLLAFHDAHGHVAEAYTPSFNALNLFGVPQPHSVTMVAPFAASRRYSVTGWLRSRQGKA